MKKFDPDRIADIVAKTLSRDFKSIKIIRVDVARDVDRDGADILRIDVVFEGKLKDSEAIKVASATRRLRPALTKVFEEDIFPLLSFVAKIDDVRGPRRREAR